MRNETEGRSDVPHFARRLCLLVRQTCGKIARAVPAHSFLTSRLRCSFVIQQILRRSMETHNSITPISVRQNTLDEKKKMRMIFPGRTKARRFSRRRMFQCFRAGQTRHIIYG